MKKKFMNSKNVFGNKSNNNRDYKNIDNTHDDNNSNNNNNNNNNNSSSSNL